MAQGAVETGEREAPALRQLEIGGIVNCQAMLLGKLDGRRPDVGRFVAIRYNLGSPFIMSASDLLTDPERTSFASAQRRSLRHGW